MQVSRRNDLFSSCSQENFIPDGNTDSTDSLWKFSVACASVCKIVATNSELGISKDINIVTDRGEKLDNNAREIELLFTDIQNGWILFTVPSYKKAYIVFLNEQQLISQSEVIPYLKHDVQLEPYAGSKISFLGVTTDNTGEQYVVFFSKTRSEVYVYDVKKPLLLKFRIPKDLNFDY